MKTKFLSLMFFSCFSVSSFANIQSVSAALEQEDILTAEQIFKTLTSQQQSSIEGRVLSGRILLMKDNTEDAFDYFETLQERYENNVDVNYYLGVSAVIMAQKASIFSKLGYAEDFIEAMERTVSLKPDHIDALNTLIGFHLGAPSFAGGDTDKALKFAQQLQQYEEEQGIAQIANVYRQTDKEKLADDTLMAGFNKFPHSGTLYFSRAQAYIQDKNWQAARADLIHAIKYAVDDEQKSQALYQQGKVSAESGEEANLGIEALSQALLIADKQYQPWVKYRLAQLYLQQKDIKNATHFIAQIDIEANEELEDKVKKLKRKLKENRKT